MNMIIGQGTVSLCDSERAIGARGSRESEKRVGRGEEREGRRGEKGRKEERRRREKGAEKERGAEKKAGEQRSGAECEQADPAKLFCATPLSRLQWCIISERSLS